MDILAADRIISNFLALLIPHNPVTNWIFLILSIQIDVFVIGLIGCAFLVYYERKYPIFIVTFLTAFIVAFGISTYIFKNVIHRDRPYIVRNVNTYSCPKDSSFPSSHAAAAFASAGIFAHYDKKRRYMYYIVAILISYSRIFLFCHYLLDVIAGGLFGGLVSYGVIKLDLHKYLPEFWTKKRQAE